MKREIVKLRRYVSDCCPNHDSFPCSTYKSRRSKKARAKSIKAEHRYVRHVTKINKGDYA